MEGFWQDVRYGLRSLFRARGVTLVAVLTLGLGIGANTAIFSVFSGLLLRPLPYPEPERLSVVWMARAGEPQGRSPLSEADFLDWRAQNRAFERVAAFADNGYSLTGLGEPEELRGAVVTAEFFSALGAQPALGRVFTTGDDEPGRERLVVLSHELWQRRFAADPQVLGRVIALNGRSRTIIGVMPPGFQFPPDVPGMTRGRVQLWSVLSLEPPPRRGPYFLWGVARRGGATSAEQADADLRAIGQRIAQEHPLDNAQTTFVAATLREFLVGDVRAALWVLLGAVAFVLLIASVNVANLLLARAAGRESEIAIRTALGATRWRIARLLLTESVLLALLGGGLGVALAYWGVDTLRAISPENLPRLDEVRLDGQVLIFTLATALLSGILCGLAPAAHARGELNESLKEGGRSGTSGRGRSAMRNLLVVSEVALALVLLIGAGLMLNSFLRLQRVSPGFTPEKILTVQISLPGARYEKDDQVSGFYTRLLERISARPEVQEAGIGISLPPNRLSITDTFTVEGRDAAAGEAPLAAVLFVSPGYFRALGVPILRGRNFDEQDRPGAPLVVIINDTLARRFFAGEDPVGKRIRVGGPERPTAPWMEIVGVVGDLRFDGLGAEAQPTYYEPHAQVGWWYTYLVMRTRQEPHALIPAVREAVWSIDRDLPVAGFKTMEELMAESVAQPRFRTLLLLAFGALALLLAGVGVYGVLAYSVAQRNQEIGIRVALGAQRGDIVALVLGHGMKLTVVGLALGAAGAFALTRVLSSLLFQVSPTDLVTFTAAAAVLAGVALLACYLPARRATRVEPLVVLRYQ
jgi:putative ABC transport system permease protein